ncbi:CocE/NonD family hydrolase [Brevibacillus daliensis]|uniref:CocE/NonD family hydrolase n=1 Tax=Brevibacillus daliensis TaxID=2892995 RepID=UPI001E300A28|nr:CocE/NonD family hydrolase [Brevibacillus daliensis]
MANHSPKHKVRIDRDVRVPMRDGITLSADIYRPEGEETYPAIVVRTPYLKGQTFIHKRASLYAEQGYAVMYMDVRGRGDSDGEFIPYRNEGIDGYDSIEWMANQPWCNGAVGTMGGSYLGRIQWLTALQKPPHLKAMICSVTPSDPFVEWPTGVPTPHHICWLHMVSGRMMQNVDVIDWEKIYEQLPLSSMGEQVGKKFPLWEEECEHDRLDDWWKQISYQDKFDQIDLPILHISGWYDDEQIGTPLNFHGVTQHGASEQTRASQKLLMGPWGHQINASTKVGDTEFGPDALIDLEGYQLRFFDYWLKKEENDLMEEPPVDIFIMGENVWRKEQEWPLARTNWQKFYLHSKGKANSKFGDGWLSRELPDAENGEAEVDRYQYDPANPVPFITEATSSQIGGPDDYSAIERRDDVLVYSTEVLTEDVEVTGPIKMQLFAASSATDTDYMVKLLDVWPNGVVQRLTDGMVRARFRKGMEHPELIEPDKVYEYTVDCWNTCHVFKKGHQIRIEVASSAFPKYDRNLNTGEHLGHGSRMIVADQTIYHNHQYPSAVLLPIIPR